MTLRGRFACAHATNAIFSCATAGASYAARIFDQDGLALTSVVQGASR